MFNTASSIYCVPVNAFMSVEFARGSHFDKSAADLRVTRIILQLLVAGISFVNFVVNLLCPFFLLLLKRQKKKSASSMFAFKT